VMNGVPFEVVPKGEIPQHLEEGVMPRGVADVLEIVVLAARTHATLTGGGAGVIPLVLAQKDGLPMKGLNQVTKNSCQRLFQPVFARLDTKLSFKPSRNRRANAPVARAPVAAIDRHPRKYQLTSTMPPGKERTDAPKAWWISDATSPSWLSETWACTLRDASSSLVRMILPGR